MGVTLVHELHEPGSDKHSGASAKLQGARW